MATEATKIPFVEAAAPATPAAARAVIYAKVDGLMYSKDDAGVETLMSSGAAGSVATDAIWDTAGDLAVGSGANTAAKLTMGALGGSVGRVNGAVAWTGGTAFPTAVTGDRFYRSDLAMEFYYNGTLWLSTTQYAYPVGVSGVSAIPWSVSTGGAHRAAAPPLQGGSDVYLINVHTAFLVSGGGSALSASHKWVGTMQKTLTGGTTTIATVTVDSGNSGEWRGTSTSVAALMNNGTTHHEIDVSWTKTGTPGTLYALHTLTYRIVAT